MNWFAVITTPGEEESFCEYTNESLHLRAVYPKTERHFRIQKQDVLSIKPMSAGCILVETEYDQNSLIYVLNQQVQFPILSVSQLADAEINAIFTLLNEDDVIKMSKGVTMNRMPVVSEGPLKGHEAMILKINAHKRIAEMRIKINDKTILTGLEIVEKR